MDEPIWKRIRTAWGVWRRRNQTDEHGRYPEVHWSLYLRRPLKWPDPSPPFRRTGGKKPGGENAAAIHRARRNLT